MKIAGGQVQCAVTVFVEAGYLRTLRTNAHPGNAAVEKIQVYAHLKNVFMTNKHRNALKVRFINIGQNNSHILPTPKPMREFMAGARIF